MQGVRVRSLVGELRSHMPRRSQKNRTKQNKTNKKEFFITETEYHTEDDECYTGCYNTVTASSLKIKYFFLKPLRPKTYANWSQIERECCSLFFWHAASSMRTIRGQYTPSVRQRPWWEGLGQPLAGSGQTQEVNCFPHRVMLTTPEESLWNKSDIFIIWN